MNDNAGFSIFTRSILSSAVKNSSIRIDNFLEKSPLPKPLKNKKLILSAAGILLLIIFFTLLNLSPTETNIPVYTVKKGNFLVSVTESGELKAKNSISISTPRVRGNIKIVYLGSYSLRLLNKMSLNQPLNFF